MARKGLPSWLSAMLTMAIGFAIVALVQNLFYRLFIVPSGSMENTMKLHDRIVVDLMVYDSGSPQRGDVVVFRHGEIWSSDSKTLSDSDLVNFGRDVGDFFGLGPSNYNFTTKRVIGVGGDVVSCCDAVGRVLVNGKPITEPYIFEDLAFTPITLSCTTQPRSSRCFDRLVVPEGSLLVLGDHRSNSADSVISCRRQSAQPSCARYVRVDQVVGKVLFSLLPPHAVA